jgi:hypothetical protein
MAETSYAKWGDLSLAYQVFGDGPVEFVFVAPTMGSHVELCWILPEFKAFSGSAEAQLASMPTPGRRTAMRRSDRAVEAIARRAPWILRGMARLAPATDRR